MAFLASPAFTEGFLHYLGETPDEHWRGMNGQFGRDYARMARDLVAGFEEFCLGKAHFEHFSVVECQHIWDSWVT